MQRDELTRARSERRAAQSQLDGLRGLRVQPTSGGELVDLAAVEHRLLAELDAIDDRVQVVVFERINGRSQEVTR